MSTTRVEATFSARRSRVTNNSTVGKIANSSGRLTWNTAMTMTSDSAMLNVNSTSSMNAGSGRIIMARIEMRPMGTPMPAFRSDLEHRHDDDQRQRDVEREQHVQHERRQRQDHHGEDRDEADGHADAGLQI